MKDWLIRLGRMAVTLAVVAAALVAGHRIWVHYEEDPWTRDGRVRADVVQVAPDVGGLITEVLVHDNQRVKRGDLLFVIDPERYALAVRQAEAALAHQRATAAGAERELRRNRTLGDLVAAEATEQTQTRLDEARAGVAQAETALDIANLNLARTRVTAPADGTLSFVEIKAGVYLAAGRPALSLVDETTVHVDGYFEETKLRGIHIGDRAEVRIMGEPEALYGRVQSIAPAVTDRDRTEAANLLPNVNPTFSWVRLAQRIPVRVMLDQAPADLRLIAGRTATVTILPEAPPQKPQPQKAGR